MPSSAPFTTSSIAAGCSQFVTSLGWLNASVPVMVLLGAIGWVRSKVLVVGSVPAHHSCEFAQSSEPSIQSSWPVLFTISMSAVTGFWVGLSMLLTVRVTPSVVMVVPSGWCSALVRCSSMVWFASSMRSASSSLVSDAAGLSP